jgi:hypothetical protein
MTEQPIEVPCECTDPACRERVELTPEELEFARSVPNRAVIKVGHPHHQVERVLIEEQGRFQVIERIGVPDDVVAQLQLRARGRRHRGQ